MPQIVPNSTQLIPDAVTGALHWFVPAVVQFAVGMFSNPVISGAAPVPYASNTIGFPLVPLPAGASCSVHTSPRASSTVVPGTISDACDPPVLTDASVFHAVAGEVPALESFPVLELT